VQTIAISSTLLNFPFPGTPYKWKQQVARTNFIYSENLMCSYLCSSYVILNWKHTGGRCTVFAGKD
jgi:hypothetical protein